MSLPVLPLSSLRELLTMGLLLPIQSSFPQTSARLASFLLSLTARSWSGRAVLGTAFTRLSAIRVSPMLGISAACVLHSSTATCARKVARKTLSSPIRSVPDATTCATIGRKQVPRFAKFYCLVKKASLPPSGSRTLQLASYRLKLPRFFFVCLSQPSRSKGKVQLAL